MQPPSRRLIRLGCYGLAAVLALVGVVVGYQVAASPTHPVATSRRSNPTELTTTPSTAPPQIVPVAFTPGGPPAFSVYQTPHTPYHLGDKVVALTFDDGPSSVYTAQILSVLAHYQVHGTFFEIGRNAAEFPNVTRQVVAAGNVVANHTWSHPDLTKLAVSAYAGEIDRTTTLLRTLTGHITPCVRPPYGAINHTVVAQLDSRGQTPVLWSADTRDWAQPGVAAIVHGALVGLHDGSIILMHAGGGDRSQTVAALPTIIQAIQAQGYRLVTICGSGGPNGPVAHQVVNYGSATAVTGAGPVQSAHHLVGAAATPSGLGYWTTASDGGVFAFGDAGYFGSTGAMRLNQPVVGMAATPDGKGYWLTAADGGVFAFGDAGFYGSAGAMHLNSPVVGMAATPDGQGYWLTAADGGVFAFGDAGFYGSAGAMYLNKTVVGMAATPDGQGYWLTSADGGVFAFGDAGFYGSTGAMYLNKTVVAVSRTPDGQGYWLTSADGGVFAFGDAGFYGSASGSDASAHFVDLLPTPGGAGYRLIGEIPVN
ncbi:MAG: polysaccharide deacetylase family protein [Acidimicrobiales bacterium]